VFRDCNILSELKMSANETIMRIASTDEIYVSPDYMVSKRRMMGIGTSGSGTRVLSHRLSNGKYLFQSTFPRTYNTKSYLLEITK
jgi:hypothetical protein